MSTVKIHVDTLIESESASEEHSVEPEGCESKGRSAFETLGRRSRSRSRVGRRSDPRGSSSGRRGRGRSEKSRSPSESSRSSSIGPSASQVFSLAAGHSSTEKHKSPGKLNKKKQSVLSFDGERSVLGGSENTVAKKGRPRGQERKTEYIEYDVEKTKLLERIEGMKEKFAGNSIKKIVGFKVAMEQSAAKTAAKMEGATEIAGVTFASMSTKVDEAIVRCDAVATQLKSHDVSQGLESATAIVVKAEKELGDIASSITVFQSNAMHELGKVDKAMKADRDKDGHQVRSLTKKLQKGGWGMQGAKEEAKVVLDPLRGLEWQESGEKAAFDHMLPFVFNAKDQVMTAWEEYIGKFVHKEAAMIEELTVRFQVTAKKKIAKGCQTKVACIGGVTFDLGDYKHAAYEDR